MEISDVVAQRHDLSTFLVHLTSGKDAFETLGSILDEKQLKAGSCMGVAQHLEDQKCVSFSETPLQYVRLLTGDLELNGGSRGRPLAPYGVVITKRQGRRMGVNPVWYVDQTKGHNFLTNQINELVRIGETNEAVAAQVRSITPFIETMGVNQKSKEFWWEREWRYQGDLTLPQDFFVICPEDDHQSLQMGFPDIPSNRFIDCYWSLETMISRIGAFPASENDLFPVIAPPRAVTGTGIAAD